MNNYSFNVYGLGNALVDYEVEVSSEQLQELNIDKGVMTLIDEDRHNVLFSHLTGTRHNRACGGSAANTIIGVSQLGGKSFYSCRVGSDETGDFYLSDLESNGVAVNNKSPRPDQVTGKCIVMVTPDADRTMNTFLGVTGELDVDALDVEAMKTSEYLYIEGYLVSSPSALDAACSARTMAKTHQLKTAISLSDPSMVNFFRDGLERLLAGGVNLLFCNKDEALEYTKTDDLQKAIKSLKVIAEHFVITLGAEGSVIWDGDSLIEIDGHTVTAKDTNGAGDMYAGAFLYAITSGMSYQKAGELASFASAQVVQKFGPRLDQNGVELVKNYLSKL